MAARVLDDNCEIQLERRAAVDLFLHSQPAEGASVSMGLGKFPNPLVRPTSMRICRAMFPTVFCGGGTLMPRPRLQILPLVEYRSGFPYSSVNVLQDYARALSSNRFPNFFSWMRNREDLKVNPKYSIRLSLLPVTDPTVISTPWRCMPNTDDPQFGIFFGTPPSALSLGTSILFLTQFATVQYAATAALRSLWIRPPAARMSRKIGNALHCDKIHSLRLGYKGA